MSMNFLRKLTIPMDVKAEFPLPPSGAEKKAAFDETLAAIFRGEDKRKLLVIGPCSADREDAVTAYAEKLRRLADEVADKLFVVMRVYTNKPRTADGYKGMVFEPNPGSRPDPYNGILVTRSLHLRVLCEFGLPTADELLYPANHRYLSDILCYNAVGARSVENQEHRLVASGIPEPVGMKNPTSGDLSVMLNAIAVAERPQSFIYRGWAVETDGNPYAHAILRGYRDRVGNDVPNYSEEDLCAFADLYAGANLKNPAFLVDTSHANAGRNPFRQPEIAMDVLRTVKKHEKVAALFRGFMMESYLEDGCQPVGGGRFGCSITDPCLGIEKTTDAVRRLADAL